MVDEADFTVESQSAKEQAESAEASIMHTANSQAAATQLPDSNSKKATQSSSPAVKLADARLVGLGCTLW